MRRKPGRGRKPPSHLLLVDFAMDPPRMAAMEQGIPGTPIRNAQGIIKGLELDFSKDHPGPLVLRVPEHLRTADWRSWTTLSLELGNRGAGKLTAAVSIHAVPGSLKEGEGVRFTAEVPAGSKAVWRIPLLPLRYTTGWESPWGWPSQPGLGNLRFQGRVDTGRIAEIRIFAHPEGSEGRVALCRLTLSGRIKPEKWVDRYGQRPDLSWPGKVRSDAEIKRADRKEAAILKNSRSFPARDEYQAWTARPPRTAGGFFRTEEVDGRWWLVAPNGNLFYSTGMDAIVTASSARLDPAVKSAYSWLPPRKGPFAASWSSRRGEESVSFSAVNCIRKWGPREFESKARERAVARSLHWGFTSLGNWAQKEIFEARKLPYFSMGPDFEKVSVPYAARLLHDVYHPDFEQSARQAASHLAQYRDDRWLVGHFISNEVDWAGLPARVLAAAAEQPAKAGLVSYLKSRYDGIDSLNAAWGTSAASFEGISSLPERSSPGQKEAAARDLAGFRGEFAELWFQIWKDAVREADPNHLLLGSRINQGQVFPEVVAAAAKHMDVVSFNHYFHVPAKEEFDELYALAGKPFLIGEYGHNTTASGLLTTAVPVADEKERGVGFRCYTEQLAAIPYFVGGHFFQYLDEPITGRFDRETAFNGFVNVADIPYPYLVKAARESNSRIYEVHAGLTPPFAQHPRL